MGCCGSTQSSKRDWRPLEEHSCTDIPWLLLFILFCIGMGFICGFSIATGAASRLISGYDSYGNVCGQKNAKIEGFENSGLDHTDRKYVFFLDPCNLDLVNRKIKSVALCVSQCPQEELKTLSDVQKFSEKNGSNLCDYALLPSQYTNSMKASSLCPKLPVPVRTMKEMYRSWTPASSSFRRRPPMASLVLFL